MSEAAETPWAVVQRLQAANQPFDVIVATLRSRGLLPEDITVLLKDEPGFEEWSTEAAQKRANLEIEFRASAPPFHVWPALRWLTITISALIAGLGFVAESLLPVGWVALTSMAVLAAYELVRSPRRAALRLGIILLLAFTVPAFATMFDGLTVGRILSMVLCGGALVLLGLGLTAVEKILGLRDFGAQGKIFEDGDVQFVVDWEKQLSDKYAPGHFVNLYVAAQNCVEVPRSLILTLRGDSRVGFEAQNHALPIAPGCIIQAVVPVRIPPMSTAEFSFRIDFMGTGKASGRRVRLSKGVAWVNSADAFVSNVFLLFARSGRRRKAWADLSSEERMRLSPQDVLYAQTLKAEKRPVELSKADGVFTIPVDLEQPYVEQQQQIKVTEVYHPSDALLGFAASI
jgi:hypothetical protein